MKTVRQCASITGVLLYLFAPAQGDVLTLRNGSNVDGSWAGIDAGRIRFLVNGQTQVYPTSQVSRVTFGAVPAPTASGGAERDAVEPEMIGAVYYQDESLRLVPLERTTAVGHAGRKGSYWEMKNGRSPVRLKAGSKLVFVVRLARGVDPSTFSLYPLDVKKDMRRTKPDPMNNSAGLILPLTVTKRSSETYDLASAGDLGTGEYCVSPSTSNDAYCFGLDAGGPNDL